MFYFYTKFLGHWKMIGPMSYAELKNQVTKYGPLELGEYIIYEG
jgi:hypothetical protein